MEEENDKEQDEVLFEYRGGIYIRPCDRGICFRYAEGKLGDTQLEEVLPSGDYEMEIVIRKCSE